MIMNCKDIRAQARRSLKGFWKVIILISLIYKLVDIIGDFIPRSSTLVIVLVSVISTIYGSFFLFGYTSIILRLVRGQNVKLKHMFSGRFLKGLGINVVVSIYTILWSLLLIIPGIIAAIKYSMTFYIWVDNPNIGINEAINRSTEMTDGHIMDILKLELSFIGWFVLIFVSAAIIGYCWHNRICWNGFSNSIY
jgi:uncharacterized membrane protein